MHCVLLPTHIFFTLIQKIFLQSIFSKDFFFLQIIFSFCCKVGFWTTYSSTFLWLNALSVAYSRVQHLFISHTLIFFLFPNGENLPKRPPQYRTSLWLTKETQNREPWNCMAYSHQHINMAPARIHCTTQTITCRSLTNMQCVKRCFTELRLLYHEESKPYTQLTM